jgi:sugar O-acyltransferase (sialic acid O-acetyltransferase NeuD family)
MTLYGIAGTAGFAREVMPVALQMLATASRGDYELVFLAERAGSTEINGQRVMTEEEFLAFDGDKLFNVAIAKSTLRERIAAKLIAAGAAPFSITAVNAVRMSGNQIGEGAIFCPFSTVTSNAKVGRFFHANIYSYVAHDCVIGDFVTFAPGVHCNGNVIVEDHAYVGTGAIIRDGTAQSPIVIGRGAVVGMGAVVTRSVAPFATVVGNPAALRKRE